MTGPARVAFLIQGTGLGGGELLLVNHLTRLDRTAFDPIVVVTGEGLLARRLRDIEVAVFQLPLHRQWVLGGLSLPVPSTVWRLVRLLRRERVDLIHSFTLQTRNYAHAVALGTGRPLIHTSHELYSDRFRSVQWWAMNRIPSRVIVISDTVRRSLHVGTDLDAGRVVTITPGVDLRRFSPTIDRTAARAELGLSPKTPVVGIVGRFTALKGFDTFFAAMAEVARQYPELRVLVVGQAVLDADEYAAGVMAGIARCGLAQRTLLTGFTDDVPRLIASMDVLVSASREETFGLVLAEAAACGRAVVATRSGGADEVVVDGETGSLVPIADPDAMARAVADLLGHPDRREAMGRAGRWRAEARFDLDGMVRRVEGEYRRVLAPAPAVERRPSGVAGRLGP